MKKNIVIIHYNTPYLTECLVRSINLFVKDAIIYIFDNSDKEPFTAKFNNVTIIDNTKGQIINFNEWLNKYPKRNSSAGKTNNFASAKHCYSIEKCMELIGENFILLDSDVLLKKDISDLYDEESIYVGEIIKQPKFNVNRVLPFICYINVKMCINNNVHYFDDEHMYGLNKSRESEKYDTGSGFYLNTLNFKHKEIKLDDYIVHYKAGSWVDTARTIHHYKQIDTLEWLKKYKKYWSTEKNKKVVYTCITGDYDTIIEPKFITEDFDYVCFTDNMEIKSNVWEIRPLPKECEDLSQVKKQRYVKINPHKILSEYNISIWADGNVEINGDLNKLIDNVVEYDISVYVPKHPQRNCIYKEAKAVVSMKKDISEIVDKQIEKYKNEGFPEKYGLLQSNILIRKHNENDCITLMNEWFNELKNNSHRDQLSFNYVLWKNENIKIKYLDAKICKSEWFFWRGGHKKFKNNNTIVTKNIAVEKKKRKSIEELRKEFSELLNKKKGKLITQQIGIYSI